MTENVQDLFYIPKAALVIVAHADDIEFYSGTIARWTESGAVVTYCVVTDNSAGSNKPDTIRSELIETRRLEQIAAAAAVGVSDVRFLNHPDGAMQPTMELRRELTRLIRELRPDTVMIPDPTTVYFLDNTYINHPDHRAVGEAALYATFPSAGTRPIFPELLNEGYEPHDVTKVYLMIANEPNLFIDVSEVYPRKQQALRCFPSQFADDMVEMIGEWDAVLGQQHGWQYGESFRVMTIREDQKEVTD